MSHKTKITEATCVVCEAPFRALASHAQCCSDRCRSLLSRWRRRGLSDVIRRRAQLAAELSMINRIHDLFRARVLNGVRKPSQKQQHPRPSG